MSKYEAVYFVGDNQAINRVRVDSSKTRNRGTFSGSLAALQEMIFEYWLTYKAKLEFDIQIEIAFHSLHHKIHP